MTDLVNLLALLVGWPWQLQHIPLLTSTLFLFAMSTGMSKDTRGHHKLVKLIRQHNLTCISLTISDFDTFFLLCFHILERMLKYGYLFMHHVNEVFVSLCNHILRRL